MKKKHHLRGHQLCFSLKFPPILCNGEQMGNKVSTDSSLANEYIRFCEKYFPDAKACARFFAVQKRPNINKNGFWHCVQQIT